MTEVISGILGAFGLSVSAGLNAYIPLLVVSLLAKFTDLIELAKPWDALESWWTIGVLVVLVVIEAIADKVPVVDHVNDAIQTFIRPTAGAVVFAAAASQIGDVNPTLGLIAGLFVSGSVHAVKTLAVRPAINAASGGLGNVPASIGEQASSTFLAVFSIIIPVLVAIILILLLIIIAIWANNRKQKKTARSSE